MYQSTKDEFDTQSAVPGIASLWAGCVLSFLPALLLMADAVSKLIKLPAAVLATVQLGYPESAIIGMGAVLLVSALLYLAPRTAILGAILLTGYLGGAAASKVRVQAGAFAVLFPVLLGVLLWGGLWLRDPRLRDQLPLQSASRQPPQPLGRGDAAAPRFNSAA